MIDKGIVFLENNIKPKNAFNIYSKQDIIQPTVGFDYVEQYCVNSEQDTLRETTCRIWQLKSNQWVVTHMQVSRQIH